MLERLKRYVSRSAHACARLGGACSRWVEQNFVKSIFGSIALTLAIIVLWPHCVVFIPAGHAGVLWSRFFGGTVMDRNYKSGAHLILPWDLMTVYDLRIQLVGKEFDVLTSDGLNSTVDVAFRFHLDDQNLTVLHEFIGPSYLDKLIVSDVASQTRRIFSQFRPEQAFTEKREEIENAIMIAVDANLMENFNPKFKKDVRFVFMDDIMIRSVKLPDPVAQAIERKVQEFHRAQQYTFTLQAERKEAERKEIEADGIRRFQDIVRPGLTDSYLRWRGVEATLTLAQSPNSKVVIIGSGPGGLPVILGNLEDSGAKGKAAEKTDKAVEKTDKAVAKPLTQLPPRVSAPPNPAPPALPSSPSGAVPASGPKQPVPQ